MIIDKKGKIFGKISIIDILIIAIVITGVFFLYRHTFNRFTSLFPAAQTDNIRITFTSIDIPGELASRIKKGDAVKEMNTENVYGKVVDVILDDSPYYGYNSDGKAVLSARPGFKTVIVVVEGKGKYSDSKAFFSNEEYYANEKLGLVAGRVVLWASVLDIVKF